MQLPNFGTEIQNETGVDIPSRTHLDEMPKTLKSLGLAPIISLCLLDTHRTHHQSKRWRAISVT